MNTGSDLNPAFADAVRAELAAIGTAKSRLQRHQRHTRLVTAGIGVIAVIGVTTGAAVVINSFPGSTQVAALGSAVSTSHTGTATIDLGPAPADANSIVLDVTCISDKGNISIPSTPGVAQDASGKVVGTGMEMIGWDCAKSSTAVHISDGYLAPGSTSITVTADAGTSWKADARYGNTTVTPWGINAHGQTFGDSNKKDGVPDLLGALGTNGKVGFINSKELDSFEGTGYINVYESDGTTVIGKFPIGLDSQLPVPVPSS
jgi:hypothetical protein